LSVDGENEMKHLSTSLLLTIFISLNCTAQLLVGPVVSGSVSKVFFFDDQFRYQSSPTLGFDLGLMASMRVHKNFVLNGQLLYSQRGRHVTGVNDPRSDNKFDLYSSMQYIELPLFYVLEFKKNTGTYTGQGGQTKTYNWFIGGGPVISYWLSNSGTIKSSYLLESNIESLEYTTVFGKVKETSDPVADAQIEGITDPNRFQFGLNLTGGFAFQPVGANKIVTSVHVYFAQTFLSDKGDGFFPISFVDVDLLKVKNHTIRFSVAYLFDTKIETRNKGKSTQKTVTRKRKR
jgi:hypothetical protein